MCQPNILGADRSGKSAMFGQLTFAGGHLPGGRLAGDFFGVGQLTGDIFMCYFNMVVNEITFVNIAS